MIELLLSFYVTAAVSSVVLTSCLALLWSTTCGLRFGMWPKWKPGTTFEDYRSLVENRPEAPDPLDLNILSLSLDKEHYRTHLQAERRAFWELTHTLPMLLIRWIVTAIFVAIALVLDSRWWIIAGVEIRNGIPLFLVTGGISIFGSLIAAVIVAIGVFVEGMFEGFEPSEDFDRRSATLEAWAPFGSMRRDFEEQCEGFFIDLKSVGICIWHWVSWIHEWVVPLPIWWLYVVSVVVGFLSPMWVPVITFYRLVRWVYSLAKVMSSGGT